MEKIVEKESKKPDVIGINVFGSVARGEEKPESDLDVEIISTSAKEWNYSTKIIDGVYVDYIICPKDFLLMRIEKYPYLSYGQFTNKTLYDPTGFLKEVKNKLKLYFDIHPEVVKFWKDKNEYVKNIKANGGKPESTTKSYDEAEILFSDEHKVTRNFFNS